MTPEIQALIDLYKNPNLTNRERATIEYEIWERWTERTDQRRVILRDLLGVNTSDSESRSSLKSCGSAANPLWDRVESKQMPLSTAADIVKAARAEARRSPLTVGEIIEQKAREYDARPFTKKSRSGQVFRWGPPQKPGFKSTSKPLTEDDRAFWKWIRENIGNYAKAKLQNVDPIVAEEAIKRFEVEMRAMIDDLQGRVSRASHEGSKRTQQGSFLIARESLSEACFTLSIDPPRWGAHVDIEKAQRQKKKLVQLYHPDKHGGDESLRPQYDKVLEAFQVIEDYNDMLKRPSGEVQHGGSNDGD
jgi:hypothetical protein